MSATSSLRTRRLGRCDGIGSGCVSAPNDGLAIYVFFFGTPVLLTSYVVALGVVLMVRFLCHA